MKQIKSGFIYNTNGQFDWSKKYATGPTLNIIDDKVWRIYYSSRDENNHTRPSYIEVEAENPEHILYVHDKPLLDIGKIGTFDDCGVSVMQVFEFKGKLYMYYLGYTVRNTISYHNSTGLAISEDGGKTFRKFSEGPIMSPTYKEPYCNGGSYFMVDGDIMRMWYTSFLGWETYENHPEPLYHIKYAESKNGVDWDRNQIVSVDFKEGEKGGIAVPAVVKEDGFYRMWYSYRDAFDYRTNPEHSYKIGYAESKDGKVFERMDDKFKIIPTKDGWDSVMQAYTRVVKHKGKYWVFYNGNGFGQSGFGYAVFED